MQNEWFGVFFFLNILSGRNAEYSQKQNNAYCDNLRHVIGITF